MMTKVTFFLVLERQEKVFEGVALVRQELSLPVMDMILLLFFIFTFFLFLTGWEKETAHIIELLCEIRSQDNTLESRL